MVVEEVENELVEMILNCTISLIANRISVSRYGIIVSKSSLNFLIFNRLTVFSYAPYTRIGGIRIAHHHRSTHTF